MPESEIPVFKPLLEAQEFEAAVAALKMGWLGMGSYVGEFEEGISDLIEADKSGRQVVAVSTGHAALHLALMLMDIGPGDEVITPSFNNIADFQAISAVGADPVFCDIDDQTLCIDPDCARGLISERTKVIIAMDYACAVCDHDAIQSLAREFGLRVIHDAAHSIGSMYKGMSVGSFSDVTMFSFDPIKTITTIDGGALVVKTDHEIARLKEMRLIGMGQPSEVMYQNRRAWTYDVRGLGFRYHLANLHAAIGLAQLAKFDYIATTRRDACRNYNERLSRAKDTRVPQSDFKGIVPFLYYIRVPADTRDELRVYLHQHGIDTGLHWQPGHWFTMYQNCRRGELAITERVAKEIMSLPLHSGMSKDTIDRICNSIKDFMGTNQGLHGNQA